jgi:hypothetical protein
VIRRLRPGDDDILRALEPAYERPVPMALDASAGASREADQVLWTWAT